MHTKFGKNLQYLRKKRGLTQSELGLILNVGQQTIAKWENNKRHPDIFMVFTIAKHFKVEPTHLVMHLMIE